MFNVGPTLYATAQKGKEVRHLLIISVDGSRATQLIRLIQGVEELIGAGTEFEMKEMANGHLKLWAEQEGFQTPRSGYAFEPLESTIALATRMGFTVIYDERFKNTTRAPLNLTGAVPLANWPGIEGKNGGTYVYAVDQMRLYAHPTLPATHPLSLGPSGTSDFAGYLLKVQHELDLVGPHREFLLTGNPDVE